MVDVRSLIGKPWAVPCDPPNTFDCWELVRHVRALSGRSTPSVVERGLRAPTDRLCIRTPPAGWYQLDKVAPFCVARIGDKHVGVMLSGTDVVHCDNMWGVCVDRLRTLPPITFWEYAE